MLLAMSVLLPLLFFCAGLSHLKVKLLEECRAALVALARTGAGPPRNLELICDSVNARDDVSAAVALDLCLGKIGRAHV